MSQAKRRRREWRGGLAIALISAGFAAAAAPTPRPIVLAEDPALSPSGRQIAFSHQGDVWVAPVSGGAARRVTRHEGDDTAPHFSRDGKQLAFISDRSGAPQAHVMDARGGPARQLTFHSEGCGLHGWLPDGGGLLLSGNRDHHWRHAERFWTASVERPGPERPWFDAYGSDACLSRDGRRMLFVREGERWWRLGYHGARSAQIWMYDLDRGEFTKLVERDGDCRWPLWMPNGRGFYFTNGDAEGSDLWACDIGGDTKRRKAAVSAEDLTFRKIADLGHGSIVQPALSANGRMLAFRHLGDLYRLAVRDDAAPERIELVDAEDLVDDGEIRRTLNQAGAAAFSPDGLDIAIAAGGDIWVMDTLLREPAQVTDSAEEDGEPLFSSDADVLWCVRVVDGQSDIWKYERTDTRQPWWRNREFRGARFTQDAEVESNLQQSRDGKYLFYVRGRGELCRRPVAGGPVESLADGFDAPDYDISPDGRWVAYSQSDNDFNKEIWLAPVDKSRPPFNLSRHPDDDTAPRWSPNGRLLSFTGRRTDDEIDIHYVWLRAEDAEETTADRKLEAALAKVRAARKLPRPASTRGLKIDFERIHERVRRVTVEDSVERSLVWSPDGKKLAFQAKVKGQNGVYSIALPGSLTPTLVTTTVGSGMTYLKDGALAMLAGGVPTTVDAKGQKAAYAFSARQRLLREERHRAVLDACWRVMRDHWYDERFANRDWSQVRQRYLELAAAATDESQLQTVVHLMLGELNGSHLGFTPTRTAGSKPWTDTTAHLGVRFDPSHQGPGLKIRDVLPGGPASRQESRLNAGERVVELDGKPVDGESDLTALLNGAPGREIRVTVEATKAPRSPRPPLEDASAGPPKPQIVRRTVVIRAISYGAARQLLYNAWLEHNRQQVEGASHGRLGYLHIQGMNQASFLEFERQLYLVGYGRDGLVIDVRENGGGSTTDLLLTALTQPEHAITVPRGGGPGYPHSRKVFATWSKPIVVLCNQNSYSNAEIFSHAIKLLGRGKLVGAPTAGGVVSTGAVRIMDAGTLRLPFRGWFLRDSGQDMELNGATPDFVVWPEPGELPSGKDRQLEKAIEVLDAEVKQWKAQPRPKLIKASERSADHG